MKKCVTKVNGISLSNSEFDELKKRTSEKIEEQHSVLPEKLSLLDIYSKIDVNNLNLDHLSDVAELDNQLREKYDIEDEYFFDVKDDVISVNHELIDKVNKKVDDIKNITPETVESAMNEIMFGNMNELTGFSSDPQIESPYTRMINHNNDTIHLIKTAINQLKASLSIPDPLSKEYTDILSNIRELKKIINGSGKEGSPDYEEGLNRLNKRLGSKTEATRFVLMGALNNDVRQLDTLSKKNDLYSIQQATYLLDSFISLQNMKVDKTKNTLPNLLFSKKNLRNPDYNDLAIEVKNFADQVINQYLEIIEERKVEAVKKIVSDTETQKEIEIERKRQKEIAVRTKVNLEFEDYDVLTNPTRDMNVFDAWGNSGETQFFSSSQDILFHKAIQIFNEEITYFQGIASNIVEKLDEQTPIVSQKLRELGYGVLGSATDFRIFYKNDKKDKQTLNLISRESYNFTEQLDKVNNSYYNILNQVRRGMSSGLADKTLEQANIARANHIRKTSIMIDPRTIDIFKNNPKYDRFKSYLIDDGGANKKEIMDNLQSDISYKNIEKEAIRQIDRFKVDYNREVETAFKLEGKTNINDLSSEAQKHLKIFIAKKSPFYSANYYEDGIPISIGNSERYYPELSNYNVFVPRRFKTTISGFDTVNKKITYNITTEPTGFYDENYNIIENNPELLNYLNIIKEALALKKHLPYHQQKELNNGRLPGKSHSPMSLLLDPNLVRARRMSKFVKNAYDGLWKGMSITKQKEILAKSFSDNISNLDKSKVSTSFINTHNQEIKEKFLLSSIDFISTFTPGTSLSFERKSNDPNIRIKGKYKFNKFTNIQWHSLTNRSKEILADALGINNTDTSLMKEIGISLNSANKVVPVGSILYKKVIQDIALNQDFNLPATIKQFVYAVTAYASKAVAEPQMKFLQEQSALKTKAKSNYLGRESGKTTGKQRTHAVVAFDNFMGKHIYTDNDLVGLDFLTVKTEEEKEIIKELDKEIEREMSLPDGKRNQEHLNFLTAWKENIGSNFSAEKLFRNYIATAVRVIGLSFAPGGALFNVAAGMESSYLNGLTGLYFPEDSMWKAEQIAVGSVLKLLAGTLRVALTPLEILGGKKALDIMYKHMIPDAANKVSIMVARLKLFDDSTDILYNSNLNTAVNNPTSDMMYVLQRTAEYYNQSKHPSALMDYIKVENIDGTRKVSVLKAIDKNGRLLPDFRTKDNVDTWELCNNKKVAEFRELSKFINIMHEGDYRPEGGPLASRQFFFKIATTFRNYFFRYMDVTWGKRVYIPALKGEVQGRMRSLTMGSGSIFGLATATMIGGINPSGMIAGALLGGILGKTIGYNKAPKIYTNIPALNYILEMPLFLSQALVSMMMLPMIPFNVIAGKKLFPNALPYKFLSYTGRDNPVDDGTYKAAVGMLGLMIIKMLSMLIMQIIVNQDDRTEKEKSFGDKTLSLKIWLAYLALNTGGQLLGDAIQFLFPSTIFNKPAMIRFISNIYDWGQSLIDIFTDNDAITGGKHAGESKIWNVTQKFIPAIGRNEWGLESLYGDQPMAAKEFKLLNAVVPIEKQQQNLLEGKRTVLRKQLRDNIPSPTDEQLKPIEIAIKKSRKRGKANWTEEQIHNKAVDVYWGIEHDKIETKVNIAYPTLSKRPKDISMDSLKLSIEKGDIKAKKFLEK